MLARAWNFALVRVFEVGLYEERVGVLAGCLTDGGEVGHVVALDLAIALVDFPLGLVPVVIRLAVRLALLLPEFMGALADFLFAVVGHGRAPFRFCDNGRGKEMFRHPAFPRSHYVPACAVQEARISMSCRASLA